MCSVKVPLDYSAPSNGAAAVALIKFPSRFEPGEDGYRGPVLFNPGVFVNFHCHSRIQR